MRPADGVAGPEPRAGYLFRMRIELFEKIRAFVPSSDTPVSRMVDAALGRISRMKSSNIAVRALTSSAIPRALVDSVPVIDRVDIRIAGVARRHVGGSARRGSRSTSGLH